MAGYEFEEESTDAGQKKKTTGASVQVRPLDFAGRSESERAPQKNSRPWRPVSLRYPFLLGVLASTIGLIVVLQFLLARSERDQGILFAENINDLPISRTFGYSYAPTVISVVFGMMWTWIDLDLKRLEPFFQLSRPEGALAKDSILLDYPFQFAIAVPFKALKRRHWCVFLSSTATLLVLFGLIPTQAGIFAVRTVVVERAMETYPAKAYLTLEQQSNLTAAYAQSVYNIAWLNESLPPFMAKDYVLDAFGPLSTTSHTAQNITGLTTMYSVDVNCENPVWHNSSAGVTYANSTTGCSYKAPVFRPIPNNDTSKPYDTIYVGYSNQNGFADYYLSQECPTGASQTFFVRWSKSSESAIKAQFSSSSPEDANSTSLFCTSSYFQQPVRAVVSLPQMAPASVSAIGPKLPLPADMFNASSFEWAMGSAQEQHPVRGPYPVTGYPEQKTHLQRTPLNLAYLPKMASFAIAAHQLPMERYLNASELAQSYQKAYRMLFARKMVDVLSGQLDQDEDRTSVSSSSYTTQSVAVVAGFVHAATVILGLVATLSLALVIVLRFRPNELRFDPGSISALMSLTKGSAETIVAFSDLDSYSDKELQTYVSARRLVLSDNDSVPEPRLRLLKDGTCLPSDQPTSMHGDAAVPRDIKGVQPDEMKLNVGLTFFALHITAATVFAALYALSKRNDGLPLPSKATITRQVLENYLPVAFATLSEPFWLVLNRLLCLLQPYEQLQRGNARASRSVDLNYSSLPPQLVFWKAIKARHLLLVLVCLVSIATNALTVALSGLMYENVTRESTPAAFQLLYAPVIRDLNATGLPFNAGVLADTEGGNTREQFYRDMSNLTAGTPLPPWTDGKNAWLPVRLPPSSSNVSYQVTTRAFSTSLECEPLILGDTFSYILAFKGETSIFSNVSSMRLNVSLPQKRPHGARLHCHDDFLKPRGMPINTMDSMPVPPSGRSAVEIGVVLSNDTDVVEDIACRQYIVAGWLRTEWQNVTQGDDTESTTENSISGRDGEDKIRLKALESTLMLCKPLLTYSSHSSLTVNSEGLVQSYSDSKNSTPITQGDSEPTFRSGPQSLIAQANRFLIDNGATWHQDAFPSDWVNYLLMQHSSTDRFLDHGSPPPAFADMAPIFSALYKRLFAILLSTNIDLLFEPMEPEHPTVTGEIITHETKIFVSFSALVVTECVLGLCLLATILLYAKRQSLSTLPRLPTNVASAIGFFAASNALREMDVDVRGTGELAWGYGRFVGADGKKHVGIERSPLVTKLCKEDFVNRRS